MELLSSGSALADRQIGADEEAGTSPGDRRFRPDVEGLRAVAVVLVVLYHAQVPALSGGYVGVDVFFVISGFVITGVLLRERNETGGSSLLNFYARRLRRILPAATLVILATVVASYLLLGYVSGDSVANDGRWAAVFLSNLHFAKAGTNYLTSMLPPSPLQNYWSLSVEEQFYIVFPTLFLLATRIRRFATSRLRLAFLLTAVVVASYGLSIVQTASSPTAAYFSPFTHAWELAIGGLVAVASPGLRDGHRSLATGFGWAGVVAVISSAFLFNGQTAYPGSIVAIPVVGTALVIASGTPVLRWGPEWILRNRTFQWLGRRSYSFYLWHWPILVIAAEYAGRSSLSTFQNLMLVAGALAFTVATYSLVENPIRHLGRPSMQTVLVGVSLVAVTVAVLSLLIVSQSVVHDTHPVVPARNLGVVVRNVASATRITQVPSSINPAPFRAVDDYGAYHEPGRCQGDFTNTSEPICVLGDRTGKQLMVLYGDSHALMWLSPLKAIASAAHWRLVVLGKPSCPAAIVTVASNPSAAPLGSPYVSCDAWHRWAIKEIAELDPRVIVVSEEDNYATPRTAHSQYGSFTPTEWRRGVRELFAFISKPGRTVDMLGNIPVLSQSGPTCLADHSEDAQLCSVDKSAASASPLNSIERNAAKASGERFVDPTPWFCSTRCTAIIDGFDVYLDKWHVSNAYATYLENALGQALDLPPAD